MLSRRYSITVITFVILYLVLPANALNPFFFSQNWGEYGRWTPLPTTGAPVARARPTAVWTGAKMIIWGGDSCAGNCNSNVNSDTVYTAGGAYDPSTNTWSAISTTGEPTSRVHHSAIWTGSKMIIWGGVRGTNFFLNTGGLYDPSTDSWTAISTTGAPSGRSNHAAVWTGTKMIVWGGYNAGARLADGGIYDPATDSWTTLSNVNAPQGRSDMAYGWVASRFVVWGGHNGTGALNTGGVYDIATDTWTATTLTNAPGASEKALVGATSTHLYIWSGNNSQTGYIYDPASDTWAAMSTINAPTPRIARFTGVMTNNYFAAICGIRITGYGFDYKVDSGYYDLALDRWTAISNAGSPCPRSDHAAVWTGSSIIVWGGADGAAPINSGAIWTR